MGVGVFERGIREEVSVHFEIAVDVFDELEGGEEGDGAEGEEEDVSDQQGVREVLHRLQHPTHGALLPVVVDRVHEHKHPRRSTTQQ